MPPHSSPKEVPAGIFCSCSLANTSTCSCSSLDRNSVRLCCVLLPQACRLAVYAPVVASDTKGRNQRFLVVWQACIIPCDTDLWKAHMFQSLVAQARE